jgi:subtilisin family serine protease
MATPSPSGGPRPVRMASPFEQVAHYSFEEDLPLAPDQSPAPMMAASVLLLVGLSALAQPLGEPLLLPESSSQPLAVAAAAAAAGGALAAAAAGALGPPQRVLGRVLSAASSGGSALLSLCSD